MELRMFHTWQQFKSIYSEVMKKILFIALNIILSAPTFGADGNHRDYSPKSLEAAAFDRISTIPVDNYTGSLAFSIKDNKGENHSRNQKGNR